MNRNELLSEDTLYSIRGVVNELTTSPYISPDYIIEKLNIVFQGKYRFTYGKWNE